MRAGALDRFIEIQRVVETQDDAGGLVHTWSRLMTTWARVESVSAVEHFAADRDVGTRVRVFVIRHYSDITHKDRIVYEDRNYDILSLEDVEGRGREHFMRIVANWVE